MISHLASYNLIKISILYSISQFTKTFYNLFNPHSSVLLIISCAIYLANIHLGSFINFVFISKAFYNHSFKHLSFSITYSSPTTIIHLYFPIFYAFRILSAITIDFFFIISLIFY